MQRWFKCIVIFLTPIVNTVTCESTFTDEVIGKKNNNERFSNEKKKKKRKERKGEDNVFLLEWRGIRVLFFFFRLLLPYVFGVLFLLSFVCWWFFVGFLTPILRLLFISSFCRKKKGRIKKGSSVQN